MIKNAIQKLNWKHVKGRSLSGFILLNIQRISSQTLQLPTQLLAQKLFTFKVVNIWISELFSIELCQTFGSGSLQNVAEPLNCMFLSWLVWNQCCPTIMLGPVLTFLRRAFSWHRLLFQLFWGLDLMHYSKYYGGSVCVKFWRTSNFAGQKLLDSVKNLTLQVNFFHGRFQIDFYNKNNYFWLKNFDWWHQKLMLSVKFWPFGLRKLSHKVKYLTTSLKVWHYT